MSPAWRAVSRQYCSAIHCHPPNASRSSNVSGGYFVSRSGAFPVLAFEHLTLDVIYKYLCIANESSCREIHVHLFIQPVDEPYTILWDSIPISSSAYATIHQDYASCLRCPSELFTCQESQDVGTVLGKVVVYLPSACDGWLSPRVGNIKSHEPYDLGPCIAVVHLSIVILSRDKYLPALWGVDVVNALVKLYVSGQLTVNLGESIVLLYDRYLDQCLGPDEYLQPMHWCRGK